MSAHTIEAQPANRDVAFPTIAVVQAVDPEELAAVLEIRRRVFAVEQHAADLRITDPDDRRSLIALASIRDNGHEQPVATGRLTPPARRNGEALVAWVATVPEARGRGAGNAVMRFLLDAADHAGMREVVLAAQFPAERFYCRLGFLPAGPLYDVRGMPHRRMVRLRPT
jgi:ElaA protein